RPSQAPSPAETPRGDPALVWERAQQKEEPQALAQPARQLLDRASPELRAELLAHLRQHPLWRVQPFERAEGLADDLIYRRGMLELDDERVLLWSGEAKRGQSGLRLLHRGSGRTLRDDISSELVSAVARDGERVLFATVLSQLHALDLAAPKAAPVRLEVQGPGATFSNPVLALGRDSDAIYALCGQPGASKVPGGVWRVDRSTLTTTQLSEDPHQGRAIATTPTGQLIVAGGHKGDELPGAVFGRREGGAWSFELITPFECEDVVVTPSGDHALVGTLNGDILVLALQGNEWKQLLPLGRKGSSVVLRTAHEGQLRSLALTPSGDVLISAAQPTDRGDAELALWKAKGPGDYEEIARLHQHSSPRHVSVSADGSQLYVAYADRSYAAWYLPALSSSD
ncbi:MAG TPA: hypothetical protein DEA08_04015, partial [Planctomycetes bacterium]|nr:hypothetical protein [Planctomycetota bacterium]